MSALLRDSVGRALPGFLFARFWRAESHLGSESYRSSSHSSRTAIVVRMLMKHLYGFTCIVVKLVQLH